MSLALRARVHRLELVHAARAQAAEDPRRRWVLLNLAVAVATGADPAPWRAALAGLPPRPPTPQPILTTTERAARILALLCRAARDCQDYRGLLALAIKAGLANDRQAEWIEGAGLLATTEPGAHS